MLLRKLYKKNSEKEIEISKLDNKRNKKIMLEEKRTNYFMPMQ